METHTREKPYTCTACNKGFTCPKQLKVHMSNHTDESTPTDTDKEVTKVPKNIDECDEQKPRILDLKSTEYFTKFPIAMEQSVEGRVHDAEESKISSTKDVANTEVNTAEKPETSETEESANANVLYDE